MRVDQQINPNAIENNNGIGAAGVSSAGLETGESGEAKTSGIFGGGFLTNENHGNVENTGVVKGLFKDVDSAQDIMNGASNLDVDVIHQKMAVLSNVMTPEDYREMMKEGVNASTEPLDVIVTVNDKIKMALAEAGCDISDMGGSSPTTRQMEAAGASSWQVNALENAFREADIPATDENLTEGEEAMKMAQSLEPLDEGAKKYIMENRMDPTIANLYKAQNSASATLMPQAQTIDFTQLEGQMQKVIDASNVSGNDNAMDMARWLVSNDISLTPENLEFLDELNTLTLPPDQVECAGEIAAAVADGKRPSDANLCGGVSLVQRAVDAMDVIDRATEADAAAVLDEGRELNIKNLREILEFGPTLPGTENTSGGSVPAWAQGIEGEAAAESANLVHIRQTRILTEIRIEMTVEANYTLLKQGVSLETESLFDLSDKLKAAEDAFFAQMLRGGDVEATDENIATYSETMEKVAGLPVLSAYALGARSFSQTTITTLTIDSQTILEETSIEGVMSTGGRAANSGEFGQGSGGDAGQGQQGNDRAATLADMSERAAEAMRRYETLWTAPRADMGDSIKKAFSNVDDILADLNMDVNPENERAVRILAYNSTEITVSSITHIKAADAQVQNLMRNMSPSMVVHLIHEGVNPLDTNIADLNEAIEAIKEEGGYDDDESMAEYLWKAERAGELTEDERATYIGVYRLFAQIEKSDSAVVGSLVQQGAPLTMRNLLTGIRSSRDKGMDFKVDDSFGSLEEISFEGTSILDQLEASFSGGGGFEEFVEDTAEYVRRQAEEARRMATPERVDLLLERGLGGMTGDEVLETMSEVPLNEETELAYANEELSRFYEAATSETEIIQLLEANDEPVTYYNLQAIRMMMSQRNRLFNDVSKYYDENGEVDFDAIKQELIDRMGEDAKAPEDMARAQEELARLAERASENVLPPDREVTSDNLRDLKLARTQIELTQKFARNEQYAIPVVVEGQSGTLHLQIVRADDSKGRVNITLENEILGKIAAEIADLGDRIEGLVATESEESTAFLREGEGVFREILEQSAFSGEKEVSMHFVTEGSLDLTAFESRELTHVLREAQSSETASEEYRTQTSVLYGISKAFVTSILRVGRSLT
ncbi:MAG: DUF6240 domain-containing protein [Eubacterium sp.]|nr:DUF6240 domain-containing protein [Eubacterium sp.]